MLRGILESTRMKLSNMKPSEWNETHRHMATENSPYPGRFSYNRTPYLVEVVNHLSPESSKKVVAVMKGAQIGFSTGVIEAGIGWIISEHPCNILFLTGHADLAEEAMTGKIDQMIDSCGLRPLIRPNVLRKKNMRTGDTNKSKEFGGGSLTAGAAGNHKLLRQRSVQVIFVDDWEAARGSTAESGATKEMIEQRQAAYGSKRKLYWISTPELKQGSNIEPVYLQGDQRKYHWECPCCGDRIPLEWRHEVDGKQAGITWKQDDKGRLIEGSVGYTCQLCFGFFTEQNKYQMNLNGVWIPTAEPEHPDFVSYHLSSLYAPPGMDGWDKYVQQYLEANPPGREPIMAKMKTFTNLVLGETWEEQSKKTDAKVLLYNTREYAIGTIPETASLRDGNGRIMALTMACDLNGTEDDARLDWEVVAWSESGSSYSVEHGSIGTFVPREGSKRHKADRERWTYDLNGSNSVWPVFTELSNAKYLKDTGGSMRPMIVGIDTGHYTKFAYDFIDSGRVPLAVGLKGKDLFKYSKIDKDAPVFRNALERNKLYIVEVNKIKDELSELMRLKWDKDQDSVQPVGFMNYPQPGNGKYGYDKYFSHYEAENRFLEPDKDGVGASVKWAKKSSLAQNHFWDVRVYGMVLKDIIAHLVCRERKISKGTWADYVQIMRSSARL